MFEELSKYINKLVTILLKNGKEKYGRIVFLDSDDSTITFEDESTLAISFVKSVTAVGSSGIKQAVVAPVALPDEKEELVIETTILPKIEETVIAPVAVLPEKEEALPALPQTPPEVLAKLVHIKKAFDGQVIDAVLALHPPEFNGMPIEIKRIDEVGKSEEAKMWTNMLNQYHDGLKLHKFLPKSDKLDKLLAHVHNLSESPYLQNFIAIPQLLGYLHYLNGEKKEALEYMKQLIKLSDTPENWTNLAVAAMDCGENELALFTLKKLFLKLNFTEPKYTKVWYKFLDIIIKTASYNDFSMVFSSKYRQVSPEEKQGIMEAVTYFLFKNKQRKDAEALLIEAMVEGADLKNIALEALKKLGQADREYSEEPEEVKIEVPVLALQEKIILPPSNRLKPVDTSKGVSQYTFTSTIFSLRDNYGFINYGTNNLFFHSYDLLNCTFPELSENDQVEFKMKKGIKGNDVACEVRLLHPPKKIIEKPI